MAQEWPSTVAIIPTSHLDLFWLGDYRTCLRRGDEIIAAYLDRCRQTSDETFVIDTVIFAQHFVENNPDYVPLMRELLSQGRLEIGSAYVDHREGLVLGESIIRNLQIGRTWLREQLGVDATLAVHPDLPAINSQTPQIYSKSGVRYYVTSRKIFQNGRIWRHRAPDGSGLLMLTWPMHYVFVPMRDGDIPQAIAENWVEGRWLDRQNLEERFPAGTVPVAGSAGDLTEPEDFVRRYGKDLRAYVAEYRQTYPQIVWEYSTPARVMAPYLAPGAPDVAEVTGSIPTVWGVGSLEAMSLLHRFRDNEALLLSAEVASVVARLRGLTPVPASAGSWQGLFSEDAFFARSDPPPPGRELEWLWRMHVFTQDHNGGGQEGALSSFEKSVRQDRISQYAREELAHALEGTTRVDMGVLRTRLGASARLITAWGTDAELLLDTGGASPAVQAIEGADGGQGAAVSIDNARGVSLAPLRLAEPHTRPATVRKDHGGVTVTTGLMTVRVDAATGETTVTDVARSQVWRGIGARVSALPELGNDVTMRVDEGAAQVCAAAEVSLIGVGPLCTQVRVTRWFLDTQWTTMLTVWNEIARLDIDLHVAWAGERNLQLRLPIVEGVSKEQIDCGTVFGGSRWDDVPAQARSGWASDEVRPEVWADYREVALWLHVARGGAGMTIATTHPTFHHADDVLEAVLFRTAASCGDGRLFFTNAGRTDWHFELVLTDDASAAASELGDRAWRTPVLWPGATNQTVDVLHADRDDVILSALHPGPDGTVIARFVNQSSDEKVVRLSGGIVGEAAIVGLEGSILRRLSVDSGHVVTTLGPWEIQTIQFARHAKGETRDV